VRFDLLLGGKRRGLGMPALDEVLYARDAEAIRAYVLDQAWTSYRARGPLRRRAGRMGCCVRKSVVGRRCRHLLR
jgi:hypothetical protein